MPHTVGELPGGVAPQGARPQAPTRTLTLTLSLTLTLALTLTLTLQVSCLKLDPSDYLAEGRALLQDIATMQR